MKIFEKFNFTSKEEIIQQVKNTKLKLFFRIYQKFVRHNIVNKTLYIIIIIIEYLQLLFELFYNGSDYVSNDKDLPKNVSYYTLSFLQYINFQHFLNSNYISSSQYTLIFCITGVIVTSNFITCFVLDYLNKFWVHKRDKMKFIHSLLGLFNYLNLKIFIIPFNYIFFKSFFIKDWFSNITTGPTANYLIQSSTGNSAVLTTFQVLGSVFICMNFFCVVNAGLLYNDIDPINSKICWAQSYCDIEFFNLIIKHIVVVMNFMQGNFIYMKVILVLLFNILKCVFRIMEWYYSWQPNKIILTILEFKYLTFNILCPIFSNQMIYPVPFVSIMGFSIFMGVYVCLKIRVYHNDIIFKNVNNFTSEWEYCLLIIELIRLMKKIQNESKSISDSEFMGFISKHKKYCKNAFCAREVIISLIKDNQYEYKNEFEVFMLSKTELNVYRKTNLRDNFDILTDQSRTKCQKIIFSIIKCIILKGLHKLKQPRLLSILEAFLYIHIFDNNFHALFQLMKFFKSDVSHREKFFLFMTLSHVSEKMMEECSIKFSSNLNISTVTDYYYYHEEFLKHLSSILQSSKSYFGKLVSMKPSAEEVLYITNKLGKEVKKLHSNFNKIMYMNPYEINILRIYSFLLDSAYFMKKLASFNINRLKNNIKYFLMNDKFKNNADSQDSLTVKTALKSFQENSESAVIISSGNLENLGDVLYCNNLITPILGFPKNQVQGFSINNIIPAPVSNYHNQLMVEFYKTGKSDMLDRITNVFALSKDGFLVNIELFLTYLPNMDFGLMFIALIKNCYISIQKNTLNNKTVSYKTEDNGIIVLSKEFNIVHFNKFASISLGLPKVMSVTMPLYNINKISNNFAQNFSQLEKGETVILNFDTTELLELEYPGERRHERLLNSPIKRKQTSFTNTFLDIEAFGQKEMAACLYRKEINHVGQYFYFLILHNKDINKEEEQFDDEDASKNEIRSLKSMNSISHHEDMKTMNYDINFKKSSQMIKEELISDSYSPTFTKFANITVFSLFICIMIWVVVAFIIEMTTLQNISTLMEFISITKNLKNTVMYMILDSLLFLRAKIMPFSSVNYLLPLTLKKLQSDLISLNDLQQRFHINSISSSTNFTTVFSENSNFTELSMDGTLNRLELNTLLGMNRFSTYFQFLLNYNYTDQKMFDLSISKGLNEVGLKLDFLYRNYNKNFFKIFDNLDTTTATTLKSTILDKRNVLLIIFCVSMVFCIVVLVILLMTVWKSESHKERFLKTLSSLEDFEIEKILLTLNLFIRSVESFNSEENNMQRMMQNLEKNENYFEEFIKTDAFLNNNIEPLEQDENQTKKFVNDLKNANYELTVNLIDEKSSLINNKEQDITKNQLLAVSQLGTNKFNKSDALELNTVLSNTTPRKALITDVPTSSDHTRRALRSGRDLKKTTISLYKNEKRNSIIMTQTNKEIELLNAKAKLNKRRKDNHKLSKSTIERKDKKSFEEYEVRWSGSLLSIIITFIIVLSYFIFSVYYLYSYIDNITKMIDLSDIFNNRLTITTNFLINLNFLLMYKDLSDFNKTEYAETINKNEALYSSYMRSLSGGIYSDVIEKNNAYEMRNPCDYLSRIDVQYFSLDCQDYNIVNGLSFMILQINNDVANQYLQFMNSEGNTTFRYMMVSNPLLVDNMNIESFFLRVFLTDLYSTYKACFTSEINNILSFVLLKFSLYIVVLILFLLMFHSLYVPFISEKLNNIKRSGLFLNNDIFEKFI